MRPAVRARARCEGTRGASPKEHCGRGDSASDARFAAEVNTLDLVVDRLLQQLTDSVALLACGHLQGGGVMASRANARERIAVDWMERLIGCEPMGAADFGGGAFLSGAGSALFADGAGETATSFHGDVRPSADFPTYGEARLFEGWSCRDAAHCDHLSLISLSLHRHQIFESDIPAQDGQPTLIAANESPSLRTFQEAGGGVALSVRIS